MLGGVLAKTTRDRLGGVLVGSGVVVLLLLGGMAIYREIDVSFYYQLPSAIRELVGIPDTGDAAGLGYGAVYSFYGALTLAGLAISAGTAAIAGEERMGTLGLLLANPRSRAQVVVAKTGALLLLVGAGAAVMWVGGEMATVLLGVDMSGIHSGAVIVHVAVNSVFYGMLALAIGAWVGSVSAASGTAVAVLIISYLGAGILPLVESLADLARLFPWYYFKEGQPVLHGVAWGDLGVLAGLSLLLFAVAVVGVNRRDLRERNSGTTLLDRLRTHPLTQRIAERAAGSARVSRIALKTFSEHQGLMVVAGAVTFYMGLLMGPFYRLLPESFLEVVDQFPDALLAMVGFVDVGTAEGFLQAEVFAFTGPAALIAVTAVIGARALAGEEARGTMEVLLANPITRSKVVVEKALAMVAHALLIGAITFAGTAAGSLIAGLGIPLVNIAAISILLALVGLVFGAVALLVGAVTGQVKKAGYGAALVTLTAYLANALLPLAENLAGYARWSPFHYYLGGEPLTEGLDWGHALVLAVLFVLLVAASVPLFERRDLRG